MGSSRFRPKIVYNSPVILTVTLLCFAATLFGYLTGGQSTVALFALRPSDSLAQPLTYFRLFSWVIGHDNFQHFFGNISIILLVGPLLEEKYGSRRMLVMILITAVCTAALHKLLFSDGLLGASGIVFMLIVLASFVNFRAGAIPLTFILVGVLFVGREVIASIQSDNVSQFAHIFGGLCGSAFGWWTGAKT